MNLEWRDRQDATMSVPLLNFGRGWVLVLFLVSGETLTLLGVSMTQPCPDVFCLLLRLPRFFQLLKGFFQKQSRFLFGESYKLLIGNARCFDEIADFPFHTVWHNSDAFSPKFVPQECQRNFPFPFLR